MVVWLQATLRYVSYHLPGSFHHYFQVLSDASSLGLLALAWFIPSDEQDNVQMS